MPKCLVCSSPFIPFVDFGDMPIANDFSKNQETEGDYSFRMQVGFCENCYMVQLLEQPAREKMFHENYAFFASTSSYMVEHFKRFSESVTTKLNLNNESLVVELGSNDGIMLQHFKNDDIGCLGVEPSENVADAARKKGIEVISEFFDLELATSITNSHKKADAILGANVFCHIPYINSVYEGVKALLDKEGIFSFEDPYIGDIIEKSSFDQIYDEHVFLYSAHSVKELGEIHGLELIEVEHQITHGGSMRYTLAHKGAKEVHESVTNLLIKEKALGLNTNQAYTEFSNNVDKIKYDLIALLLELKEKGKKVVGYGATSKSTTVTNYFGITPDLVSAIYDTTPTKHNTFSPGAKIPVLPYEEFRDSDPDYVLLFAWNHAEEIMEKEKDFVRDGRKWIVYVPQAKILDD
jgi:methylation protein EvaC